MTAQSGRNTRQKDVIREALGACDVFISAQALHQRLVDGGEHISLATVYRRLNAMADSGQADTVRMNGQQMFRLCGDERHHHHLVCVSCGRTVQIDPPSETWLRSIAEEHRSNRTRSKCSGCARSAAPPALSRTERMRAKARMMPPVRMTANPPMQAHHPSV